MRSTIAGPAWITGLMALSLAASPMPAPAQTAKPGDEAQVCQSCHPSVDIRARRASLHGDTVSCLSCHHVGFTNDPEQAQARRLDACVSCHEDVHPAHPDVGGDAPVCTSCHSIHGSGTDHGAVADDDFLLKTDGCQQCHETVDHTHPGQLEDGPACVQCHTGHPDPSAPGLVPAASPAASCGSCHEDAHPLHMQGEDSEASCSQCHAIHDGPALAPPEVQEQACLQCHEDHEAVTPAHVNAEDGPTCTQCHAFATDPGFPEAETAVAQRCGTCHEEELAQYREGGHADGLAAVDPNPDLPTCVTCHQAHGPEAGDVGAIPVQETTRCLQCHSEASLVEKYDLPRGMGVTWKDDFHGATVSFLKGHGDDGLQPDVLVCSDCHGAHAVGWHGTMADVSAVCQGCHEKADAKFAGAWLGHTPPGPRNQIVIWGLRSFYYVMIPFVLFGLLLNILFDVQHQRRTGARLLASEGAQKIRAFFARRRHEGERHPMVPRFNIMERVEHMGAASTFILLIVTGLPQTRPDSPLAHWLIQLWGGIGPTRIVHRVTGVVFVGLLAMHLSRGIAGAIKRRKLPEIMFRKQDFHTALGTLKHALKGGPKPKSGKFDFREKFEYWGLFLGGTLMTVTGVILLFPEAASTVLPGIFLAAARVAHGLEATFAVLVVILWHSYGVMLRPEVFPLDTTMFTGKISLERLKEEHELEYDELFPGGAEPTPSS